MSVNIATGHHIPKDPTRFSFDEEVAPIFDNMAIRSLPLYRVAYESITEICRGLTVPKGGNVVDFGVSTGTGLEAVRAGLTEPLIEYHGFDVSQPMLDLAAKKCPYARLHNVDFMDADPTEKVEGDINIALFGWTLQFMPDEERRLQLLQRTFDRMPDGGVLFLMEKWTHTAAAPVALADIPDVFQRHYMRWRRDNGYTATEILAKTRALGGAMTPWSRDKAVTALTEAGFSPRKIFGLYQLFNFGGLVAVK